MHMYLLKVASRFVMSVRREKVRRSKTQTSERGRRSTQGSSTGTPTNHRGEKKTNEQLARISIY